MNRKNLTVLVTRKAYHDKAGRVGLQSTAGKVYDIAAVYSDGRVKTSTGDIWKVKRGVSGEADFIVDEPTFRPQDPSGSNVVAGWE